MKTNKSQYLILEVIFWIYSLVINILNQSFVADCLNIYGFHRILFLSRIIIMFSQHSTSECDFLKNISRFLICKKVLIRSICVCVWVCPFFRTNFQLCVLLQTETSFHDYCRREKKKYIFLIIWKDYTLVQYQIKKKKRKRKKKERKTRKIDNNNKRN